MRAAVIAGIAYFLAQLDLLSDANSGIGVERHLEGVRTPTSLATLFTSPKPGGLALATGNRP